MAIAYGNAKTSFSAASFTGPTVSGANTFAVLFNACDVGADNISGITWGGASMFKIQDAIIPSDRATTAWGIFNPSSGASIIITGGSFFHGYVDYWTGVNQGNVVDSSNSSTVNSGSSSISTSTNVGASNCWLVASVQDGAGNITYTTNIGTMRQGSTGANGEPAYADSNATVATGSQSVTLTAGSGTSARAMILFSLAPSGAVVATLAAHRTLQGVGL